MELLTKERITFRPKQFLLKEETLEGLFFVSPLPPHADHFFLRR